MQGQVFNAQAKTITISVTSTASTSVALPNAGGTVRITNEGPNIAFISIGSGTQTATLPTSAPLATATAVLSGADMVFSIPNDSTYNISAICRAAGTAALSVQVGEGA